METDLSYDVGFLCQISLDLWCVFHYPATRWKVAGILQNNPGCVVLHAKKLGNMPFIIAIDTIPGDIQIHSFLVF